MAAKNSAQEVITFQNMLKWKTDGNSISITVFTVFESNKCSLSQQETYFTLQNLTDPKLLNSSVSVTTPL